MNAIAVGIGVCALTVLVLLVLSAVPPAPSVVHQLTVTVAPTLKPGTVTVDCRSYGAPSTVDGLRDGDTWTYDNPTRLVTVHLIIATEPRTITFTWTE